MDDDGAQLVEQLLSKEFVDSLMTLVIFDGDVEWFVAVDVDDFWIWILLCSSLVVGKDGGLRHKLD